MKYTSIRQVPTFTQQPNYQVDMSWGYVEDWIQSQQCDMDPDFQRGHVWTREQKIAFIEFCLRGGTSARNVFFNAPNYMQSRRGLCIVDGKQRVTAIVEWCRA